MSATLSEAKRRSPLALLQQWWQAWTSNGPVFSNPACCAEGEVDRIAHDIGLSTSELRELTRHGSEAADLLLQRLTALHLDASEVEHVRPETLRDLQRVCSLCESHRRCAHDLKQHASDPAWEEYCPNVATLRALNALPWASRSKP